MTIRPLAYAFGNARVRAMRSRLRGPLDLPALQSAGSVAALAERLGLEEITTSAELGRRLFTRLLGDYRRVLDAYPAGRPLVRALLGLHEMENLKLAWRARSRGAPPEKWVNLWKPLGRLEELPLEPWRDSASIREAATACERTPYAPLLARLLAGGADPAAAEMAMDSWAGRRLAQAAADLPRAEKVARDLAFSVVDDRDASLWERAEAWRLSAENAAAAAVRGRPGNALDPAERSRSRRLAALRAFSGPPFRLAPAIALLLLEEAQMRALVALARSLEKPAPAAVARVLAGSAMAG